MDHGIPINPAHQLRDAAVREIIYDAEQTLQSILDFLPFAVGVHELGDKAAAPSSESFLNYFDCNEIIHIQPSAPFPVPLTRLARLRVDDLDALLDEVKPVLVLLVSIANA